MPTLAAARLVANRITFAATPEVDQQILTLGIEGFIENQLALDVPDPTVERRFSSYGATNPSLKRLQELRDDDRREMDHEIVQMTVVRAASSQHQLFEVLQRLWMDHFNISFGDDWEWVAHYLEQVLRPNGMGRFRDLLIATAHSPSMMVYLDNAKNTASGINENYGRELLELHTLGIDDQGRQIYTEDDVVGVSHVMSGWSIDYDDMVFEYKPFNHSTREVSILGGQWTNAGLSGKDAGDSLLNFLANHPQTARYISSKLIRRFVTDSPPESLISSAAAVYLANDTNVVPVLRHILGSAEFASSAGQKIRRPFEQVVAVLRVTGAELSDDPQSEGSDRIHDHLEDLSHAPWRHSTPDGFPDVAEPWLSSDSMLRRWEGGARISRNNWSNDDSLRFDEAALRGSAATAGELLDRLSLRLNLGALDARIRATLLDVTGLQESTPIDDVDDRDFTDLLSFLVSHPFFQLR